MVDNLLKVFERATEKFLDQISSSDDEIAVEYQGSECEGKELTKIKSDNKVMKRKPTLVATTDKKRDNSLSEESISKKSISNDSLDEDKEDVENLLKKEKNNRKNKSYKKDKKEAKKSTKDKKNTKIGTKHKSEKYLSPTRSRSSSRSRSKTSVLRSYSSSPPPSSAPSSPDDRFNFFPKKHKGKNSDTKEAENHSVKGLFIFIRM